MKTTEIRVRPVTRHIVTRYVPNIEPPKGSNWDGPRGCVETLGEFDNEAQAEQVAEALRTAAPKPRQYVVVERTVGDVLTNALYFDVEADADAYVKHAAAHGREFRVYSREITDPVKLAYHETGMVSYGFPGGIQQVVLPPTLPEQPGNPANGPAA